MTKSDRKSGKRQVKPAKPTNTGKSVEDELLPTPLHPHINDENQKQQG